jgi:hypothetical protein
MYAGLHQPSCTRGAAFRSRWDAVLTQAAWWPIAAIAAAATSALLILLTFSPWLLAGLAIDVIVLVLALLVHR